jgi:hypothetical protein
MTAGALYRVKAKGKDDMKTTRDTILLLLLILVLASIRISPAPEVDFVSPAHAAATEAENSVETVEPLAMPELSTISPAMLDWQPAKCPQSESADSPQEVSSPQVPYHVINEVLSPVLQQLTDLDVHCTKGEPDSCIVIVRKAIKT